MFKELEDDLKVSAPSHGDLSGWAEQGVLLLNTILTVQEGKPLSCKLRLGAIYQWCYRGNKQSTKRSHFCFMGQTCSRKSHNDWWNQTQSDKSTSSSSFSL